MVRRIGCIQKNEAIDMTREWIENSIDGLQRVILVTVLICKYINRFFCFTVLENNNYKKIVKYLKLLCI